MADGNSPFNRGMLMNIGFSEAQQLMEMKFQCVIFHDVDLLPENDANPYTCPQDGRPRQMSFSLDYLNHYKYILRNIEIDERHYNIMDNTAQLN